MFWSQSCNKSSFWRLLEMTKHYVQCVQTYWKEKFDILRNALTCFLAEVEEKTDITHICTIYVKLTSLSLSHLPAPLILCQKGVAEEGVYEAVLPSDRSDEAYQPQINTSYLLCLIHTKIKCKKWLFLGWDSPGHIV